MYGTDISSKDVTTYMYVQRHYLLRVGVNTGCGEIRGLLQQLLLLRLYPRRPELTLSVERRPTFLLTDMPTAENTV